MNKKKYSTITSFLQRIVDNDDLSKAPENIKKIHVKELFAAYLQNRTLTYNELDLFILCNHTQQTNCFVVWRGI